MKKITITRPMIFLIILVFTLSVISCRSSSWDIKSQGYEKDNNYKIGDRGPGGGTIFYINPESDLNKIKAEGGFKYLEVAPDLLKVEMWSDYCGTGKSEIVLKTGSRRIGYKNESTICQQARSAYRFSFQCTDACKRDFIRSREPYNRCVEMCSTCFEDIREEYPEKFKKWPPLTKKDLFAGKENTRLILQACGKKNSAARIASEYRGGGKSDWYLPSLDELKVLSRNFGRHKIYIWSSTEFEKDQSLETTSKEGLNMRSAYYYDFFKGYEGFDVDSYLILERANAVVNPIRGFNSIDD